MRTKTGLTMNGYSSKLSLYDFIVMLMPGSIILYCLMCALTRGCKLFPIDNGFFWIFFFIISYLIGMVNHILSACIFNKMMGFRNCPKMLKDSIQWANENGYDTDVDLEKITTQQCLKDKYYKAYYYARKYAYGNDIEIIESQVAFLQSLFLPVIFILSLSTIPSVDLFSPLNLQKGFCDCRCMYVLSIWIGSIITIILMAILMISRQRIIYKRVWEDYHYLRKIGDN